MVGRPVDEEEELEDNDVEWKRLGMRVMVRWRRSFERGWGQLDTGRGEAEEKEDGTYGKLYELRTYEKNARNNDN